MNRLILNWKIGAEETRTLARLQGLLDHYLRKNHIGYLVASPGETSQPLPIPSLASYRNHSDQ